MLNFKPLALDDKSLFDDFFRRFSPIISEFTFTNLFAWRLTKRHEFSIIDNHLLISFFKGNQRKFYQPVGNAPDLIMKKIFDLIPETSFERVEKKNCSKLSKEFEVMKYRNNFDYLYKLDELRELKGANYQSTRNFIRQCEKYNPQVCILDEETIKQFVELEKKWCNIRNCNKDKLLYAEDMAVKETLEKFKQLKVMGICISINDKIEAFAIGEELSNDTFVNHFQKANTEFKGLYQYLVHEFAKSIPKKFAYLNLEQDLGVEGLRKAKLSYHPVKFVEKCSIKSKNSGGVEIL